MKTPVVIIEDNIPLGEGYRKHINNTNTYNVIAIYRNCEDALKNIKNDAPKIILMDIELPGINGIEGSKKIKALYPNIEILIVTVYENSETVFNALCAGATGYLTKTATVEQLVNAMDEALNGGAPMSIHIAKMVVNSFRKSADSILSDRETEVLTLLASGKSYKSIADSLFISINTIRFHIKNIYEKLQVCSREDAIQKANDQNLI